MIYQLYPDTAVSNASLPLGSVATFDSLLKYTIQKAIGKAVDKFGDDAYTWLKDAVKCVAKGRDGCPDYDAAISKIKYLLPIARRYFGWHIILNLYISVLEKILA